MSVQLCHVPITAVTLKFNKQGLKKGDVVIPANIASYVAPVLASTLCTLLRTRVYGSYGK